MNGFILKGREGLRRITGSITTLDLKTPLYRPRFRWTSNCVFDSQKHGRLWPSLHVHGLEKKKKTRKNELDSALSGACDPCTSVC